MDFLGGSDARLLLLPLFKPPFFIGGRMETGRPPPPTYISLLSSLSSPLHHTHAPAASFTTPFDFLLLEGILNAKVTLLQLPAGYIWIPLPLPPPTFLGTCFHGTLLVLTTCEKLINNIRVACSFSIQF